jgi:vacuole morphology and inheritance protein 14
VLEGSGDFDDKAKADIDDPNSHLPTAFSLPRFIPLLKERIWVVNPFTRNFLVGWLTLLDSIPDLELVTYLPSFLAGLLKFLGDQNADVRASTQTCLDKFLNEIKRISRVKKGLVETKKSREGGKRKRQDSMDSDSVDVALEEGEELDSDAAADDEPNPLDEDWIPGQDVDINYKEILEILTSSLDSPHGSFSLLLYAMCPRNLH